MVNRLCSEISRGLVVQLLMIIVAVPLIAGVAVPNLLKGLVREKVTLSSFWGISENNSEWPG